MVETLVFESLVCRMEDIVAHVRKLIDENRYVPRVDQFRTLLNRSQSTYKQQFQIVHVGSSVAGYNQITQTRQCLIGIVLSN